MFGFVRGVRGRAVLVVLVVFAVLGGVTAVSVAAATSTTVTWKVSSLRAGQVKNLSAVATSNSPGVKTWSKTGSCTLSPRSKPTKLTMGSTGSCVLTLRIAQSGKFPAKSSMKTITSASPTTTTTVPATTTTVALTCATGGSCAVGDTGPGGGTIFYVDVMRAVGSQFWEAACAGWQNNCDGSTADPQAVWGCSGTDLDGASGTAIGTGALNTLNIVTGCPEGGFAARLAADYSNAGLTEWFLPSKDELNELYISHLPSVGSSDYWSSSEYGDNQAWYQYFYYGDQPGNGAQGGTDKSNLLNVRPVRAF